MRERQREACLKGTDKKLQENAMMGLCVRRRQERFFFCSVGDNCMADRAALSGGRALNL